MRLFTGIFFSLSCYLAFYASAQQQKPEIKDWITDLEVLSEKLPKKHKNAFHTVTQEQFEQAVENFKNKLPELNENEIEVGFRRLVAMIGDGHTSIYIQENNPWLPLRFRWFGDAVDHTEEMELRITHLFYPENVGNKFFNDYEDLNGAVVSKINDIPIEEVYWKVTSIIAQGESQGSSRNVAAVYFRRPHLLHGLNLLDKPDSVKITFKGKEGDEIAKWIKPNPMDATLQVKAITPHKALYASRLNDPYWYSKIPDAKGDSTVLYFSFSQYPSYTKLWKISNELKSIIEKEGINKLVIDLRLNTGGDYNKVRRILIPKLKNIKTINRPGIINVLIGPTTFSAAMTNALDFRNRLGAVLVGEPTGARPNQYQEKGKGFILPNSGYKVSYSIRYHKFQEEDTPGVMPDIYLSQTWEDYLKGHDPALDWVLEQTAK